MAEPRDEIEEWLGREVEPLAPPPGAFPRIQRRARRRKLNQALITAAGAVVVIAGAVLAPTVAPALLNGGGGRHPVTAPANPLQPTATHTAPRRSTAPASPATRSSSLLPTGTALSVTTSGTAPPLHFQPTSITMISEHIGAV